HRLRTHRRRPRIPHLLVNCAASNKADYGHACYLCLPLALERLLVATGIATVTEQLRADCRSADAAGPASTLGHCYGGSRRHVHSGPVGIYFSATILRARRNDVWTKVEARAMVLCPPLAP